MASKLSPFIFCLLLLLPLTAFSAIDGGWGIRQYIKITVKVGPSVSSSASYDEGTVTLATPTANKGELETNTSLGKVVGSYKQTVMTKNRQDTPKITFKGQLNKPQLLAILKPIFTSLFPADIVSSGYKVTVATFDGDELINSTSTDANAKVLFGNQKIVFTFNIQKAGYSKTLVTATYDIFYLGQKLQVPAAQTQGVQTLLGEAAVAQSLPSAKTANLYDETAAAIAALYRQQF